jgi:hypothetical protein
MFATTLPQLEIFCDYNLLHDEVRHSLHLRRWAYGMGVILVLLVAATWDMVFKPGL